MNKQSALIFCMLILAASLAHAVEPEREKGISVHALPKRVAVISGQPWGLQVAYAPYLKPEPGQPFLQSIDDVLSYVKKQDANVVKNGLWVVTTNPGAYDKEELEFHNRIKITLPKENIPLFWVRGAEIEKGFKRY